MVLTVSLTADNVKTYPLHRHNEYEIMFYIEGEGNLHTPEKDYPFKRGTAVIVPPGIYHGSVSENGFKNICVKGDFEHLLMFDTPQVLQDNSFKECEAMARTIYRHRLGDKALINSLAQGYIQLLLQNSMLENQSLTAVNKIVNQIGENAFDSGFNLTALLLESGYAEDYIRMCFTKQIGMPPVKFLNKIRIERATTLIGIYKNLIPLWEIAEKCGFSDYAYFSKKFKEIMGVSPQKYISLL